VLSGENLLEGADGIFERNELAFVSCEDLGDGERLRHETLDFTSTLDLVIIDGISDTLILSYENNDTATYSQLILFRQFIHTQNSNDILKGLVVLKNLLNGSSDVVVFLANDTGIQHARFRVQGVDSRIDTELGDTTRKDGGSVQMSEGGSRGRICQIIGGNVDGLNRCDRSLLGGGDTLLPTRHLAQ
jgi:hypothetical protein